MDDLGRIVSNHFQGRCRVEPDEFPMKDGTEVSVIPSSLPLTSMDSTMNVLVPYMVHGERKLELCVVKYMGEPTKVHVPRHPNRTGDELTLITRSDALLAQEIQLQEWREADKMPLSPRASPHKAPSPMQQGLR
jgi:hypothetical protein